MHSERTELHLQHMIERVQMGIQGEEKKIAELLFDEVYTLVRAVYKEDDKTRKVVNAVLAKYIESLKDRKILDVHKNVQVYAVIKMYQAMSKKGEVYSEQENMQDYPYTVIADDTEFEKVADTYADSFVSVRAFKRKKEAFQNLGQPQMIMMILFAYEKCTVSEICKMLKLDEAVVKNEIAALKKTIIEIGAYNAEDVSEEKEHKRRKAEKKLIECDDEEEEKGLIDYLFPSLTRNVRLGIDIAMSAVVLLVYFIFLR